MTTAYRTNAPPPAPRLPPYSGIKGPCAKCAGDFVSTTYVGPHVGEPEHMKRECWRCGYKWREATVDQSVVAK